MELPRIEKIQKLKPPMWANTGHLQTILAHLMPSPTVDIQKLEEHTLPLKDGDQLKVYIHRGKKPVMISLFHGLAGDIHSDYMQRTALVAESLGYSYILVNHRGADTGFKLAKHPYHSGRGEDASDVFEWLSKKFPNDFQLGVGVSMSGSILLNLLAGRRGHFKPHAAITVNAPLDLDKGSQRLSQGLNRIYDIRFVHRLRRDIRVKQELGLIKEKYHIPFWAKVHDIDEIFTGPAAGFGSRSNYYATCSVKDYLSQVDRPCIMLSAKDDPFVDFQDYIQSAKSKFVRTHIEATGGHVGYLGLDPTTGKIHRWLDYFLRESIQDLVTT